MIASREKNNEQLTKEVEELRQQVAVLKASVNQLEQEKEAIVVSRNCKGFISPKPLKR